VGSLIYGHMRKAMMCNTIVLANFVVFLLCIFANGEVYPSDAIVRDTGFRGTQLLDGDHPYTLLTHLFIHAGVMHLIMNMLFLMLMGMPFEQKIGTRSFLILYFGSGLGAALFSGMFDVLLDGTTDLARPDVYGIGASGAIFGIMAAFAYRYPREEIPMLLFIIFLPNVQVYIVAIAYGLIETLYVMSGVTDGVGHMAHMGGLIAGVLISQLIMQVELVESNRSLNYPVLEKMAVTGELRRILGHLRESESDESRDVFGIWLDEWARKVSCPECAAHLRMKRHRMVCDGCGFTGDIWIKGK